MLLEKGELAAKTPGTIDFAFVEASAGVMLLVTRCPLMFGSLLVPRRKNLPIYLLNAIAVDLISDKTKGV